MRNLLACTLLAAAAAAQTTAHVNDPRSHGTLGDTALSLDEAIQLMNGTLEPASPPLSAAELAQLEAAQGEPLEFVQIIEVDAQVTPGITIERQLTDIIGVEDCEFEGVNGQPLIDAGPSNVDEVLPARTNHFHCDNFAIRGGKAGVVYDATPHLHPGEAMHLHECTFFEQTEVGVRILVPAFPPGAIEPAELEHVDFDGLPIGVEVVDQGFSGDTDLTGVELHFHNCAVGLRFVVNGSGGTVDAFIDGAEVHDATTAVQVARGAFADSTLTATFTFGSFEATDAGFDVQGDLTGGSSLQLWHCDVSGGSGSGRYALHTWPSNGRTDLDVGETTFAGDVGLAAGRFAQTMRIHNSRLLDGALAIDSTGPSPDVQWTVLENAPVTVAATTNQPATFNECELIDSAVQDQTSSGVTTLARCVLIGSPVSANVVNQAPLPARWIGSASVEPSDPPIGSNLSLGVDLRPGTVGVWLIGAALSPPLSLPPYRFYFDPTAFASIAHAVRGQQTLLVTIPPDPALSGAAFYAGPAVLPEAGTAAPPLTLPRGGRFVVQ